MATAARMPMIATTIISSIKVNPLAARTFFIKIKYSKLRSASIDLDLDRAHEVGGADAHAPGGVGQRQHLHALLARAIEELRGHAPLLVLAQRVPARIADARRHRLFHALAVGELENRREI